MPRVSKDAPLRPCYWHDYGRACGKRSMYLVLVPFGSFFPYCGRHMARAITAACDTEYHRRPAGHREPVQVLPIDQR